MKLSSGLEQRLRELMRVFLAENEKLNLSALRTEERCWVGNILDSLALFDAMPDSPIGFRLLDLGTGGGFPLLPIAIARADLQCTGLDAVAKKVRAVERIVGQLGLQNVKLVIGRSEELGHDPHHRERYAAVTSRAVAPLPILIEYASSFVKVGGTMVMWKSLHIDEELEGAKNAMKELHCELVRNYEYELPDDFGKRQLLIFAKTAATPKQYPRAVGMAKKKPL